MYATFLSLMMAGAAASSPAVPPQQTQTQEIVVQGNKDAKRQIRDFVKELTPARIGGQLGRFIDPICPRALGLSAAQNAMVEERMRKVAAAVGAPVAPEKCTVNLYVLVGADKREIIDGIRGRFPQLVAGVPSSVLKRLKQADGPVAAWQIVGQIGTDGAPLTSVRTSADGDPVLIASTIGWASRIVHVTRPQFLGSIVVVEAEALDRVDTRQLADYAIMRTLAPTDTTHQLALPRGSIIQLFDPGVSPDTAPLTVTSWDYAYLKALYSTSGSLDAVQQRNEMARMMAKELAKPPADQ